MAKYENVTSNVDNTAGDTINASLNSIVSEYSRLTSEIANLELLEKQLSEVKSSASSGMVAPKQSDYEEYEDYAAAYNAYINSLSQGNSAETSTQISGILAQYGFTARSEVAKSISEMSASANTLKNGISATLETLGGTSGEITSDIEQVRVILTEKVSNGDDGVAVQNAIVQIINLSNKISGNLSAESVIKSISLQNRKVDELLLPFAEIASGEGEDGISLKKAPMELKAQLENQIKNAVTEINTIYALNGVNETVLIDDYIMHDIYLLPLVNLVKPTTRSIAIICLTIALLTDIFSLVFAMIFQKQKSILSLKSVNQVIRRDDSLFEKNVISALMVSIKSEFGGSLSETMDISVLLERLAEFVAKFHSTNVGASQGYSLQAPQSELEHFDAMLAFLSQFGLVKIVSSDYYSELSSEVTSSNVPVCEGNVVMMKTKFLLWCNGKWNDIFAVTDERSKP